MKPKTFVAGLVAGLLLSSAPSMAQELIAASQSSPSRVRVVTNAGSFVIALELTRAPLSVEHFLRYVREGHYEGTIFHRIVHGFVAQGGGYTPDFDLKPADRVVANESGNGLSNLRGTVGMARTEAPHSATSQFYVNLADNVDLNPRPTRWGYAVFGRVVEGMDVVDDIGHRPTTAGGPFGRDVPVDAIVIERIEELSD